MSRRPASAGGRKKPGFKGKRGRPQRAQPSETVEVTIEAVGAQGDGLATWTGQTLYIPGTLSGERVRVKTGAKRGDGVTCTLVDVIEPAAERAQRSEEHTSELQSHHDLVCRLLLEKQKKKKKKQKQIQN